jgi:hypothetical protein
VTVTAVSPPTAATGTPNVLLTVTGTGFESGATVSFPSSASISIPGETTFVSPTSLTLFVDLTSAVPGDYDVLVTNPDQAAVSSLTPLFTVLPYSPNGMHVSAMAPNIADPVTDDPDENAAHGWDAWDTITVESGSGAPLQGVTINGAWTPTSQIVPKDITSCVTDFTGTCTVYDGYADVLTNQTPTFTVSPTISTDPADGGLVLTGYTYTPGTNNPSSCTISAPPTNTTCLP